jgi:hypothetical protein
VRFDPCFFKQNLLNTKISCKVAHIVFMDTHKKQHKQVFFYSRLKLIYYTHILRVHFFPQGTSTRRVRESRPAGAQAPGPVWSEYSTTTQPLQTTLRYCAV